MFFYISSALSPTEPELTHARQNLSDICANPRHLTSSQRIRDETLGFLAVKVFFGNDRVELSTGPFFLAHVVDYGWLDTIVWTGSKSQCS